MLIRTYLLLQFLLSTYYFSFSQKPPKKLSAVRTTATIKVDGKLEEAAWKTATIATEFIEFRPTPGKPEANETRTEIFLLYDNNAVYVAGYCHERTTDSISTELIGRDQVGANDFVGIILDTYLDKINAVGFYVTPLGEQYDARYYPSENGEDDSWNAVWDSESQILSDGWTFEMRIPYSALRFSKQDLQHWGMNITRKRNKAGRQFMWNEFNPKISGLVNQFGVWENLSNINPPLRLSFTPYLAAYANHYPYNQSGQKNWSTTINGGMDVKLGLSQAFTLDMTLIPDFGQVQSDNKVLNLTPFEVKFEENRSFFTEGTELFSKGNLFYSRRIGAQPLHYSDVGNGLPTDHQVISNPTESKLINATKISGRTRKGLGIGILNAMTRAMFATIEDNNKNTYEIQTSPFTNYNIFVIDQTLKNNSSISLVNTSVLRDGKDYDANVSAGVWNINDKKNLYNSNGRIAYSRITAPGKKDLGVVAYNVIAGKTGGRFNFQLWQELTDDKYDNNDMGILFNNNFLDNGVWMAYKFLEPKKWYNRIQINFNGYHSLRYQPRAYQQSKININANSQLKNLWFVGLWLGYDFKANDFYEPRVKGKVFVVPKRTGIDYWVNTNQAKRYSIGLEQMWRFYDLFNGVGTDLMITQLYRFNDKISLRYNLNYEPRFNNAGYAAIDEVTNDIIFAKRDQNTVENILNLKYNFNNRMGINTRVRHYWSQVKIKSFYKLQDNGSLLPNDTYTGDQNQNYNYFNVDMVYTWQFAPGSFMNLVWKNSIHTTDQIIEEDYIHNAGNTLSAPAQNSLSLKIIYYLDFIDLRKKK
jgi:hypothetical protein